MSILIKGMEMPKDGEKLYMIAFSDGKACASYKPFEWHEVVPVPPHGRLGDLNELWVEINTICDRYDAGIITDLACLQQILSAIRHTPTIIEAEKEST